MAVSSTLPAETADIIAYKGDSFRRDVGIKLNGAYEVLTGSTFRMQIKRGASLITELSTTNGNVTIDPDNSGVLILQLNAAAMEDLASGEYTYDMQQTYADGRVKTRFRGKFIIIEDITKPLI